MGNCPNGRKGATPAAAPAGAAKILILSLGKSGTTILYQILKESLPDDAVSLFEPPACQPEDPSALRDKTVLSKVLLLQPNGRDHYRPQACAFFNRRIFLQRDPRDLLVSLLLYNAYHTAITRDFCEVRPIRKRPAGQGTGPREHAVPRSAQA